MPVNDDIVVFLNKKFFGVTDTETIRRPFEEPIGGRVQVFNSQILAETIPAVNPLNYTFPSGTIVGVVQVIKSLLLVPVPGAGNSFFSVTLRDAVPFNFDPTGSYNYFLTLNDGVTQIPFGLGDWLVDPAGGVLRFYDALPPGVSTGSPPRISFYKYVGAKGVTAGTLNSISNAGGAFGFGLFRDITGGGSTANFYNINTISPAIAITLDSINNKYDWNLVPSQIAHSTLGSLTSSDDHSQYTLLAGRNGGQQIHGGADPGGTLILQSTNNVQRGAVVVHDKLVLSNANNNGTFAGRMVLPASGINNLFTITLNNTGPQHIILRITAGVFAVANDTLDAHIASYYIKSNITNDVIASPIFEETTDSRYSTFSSIGTGQFTLRYNGVAGDIASWKYEWLVTGPNLNNL